MYARGSISNSCDQGIVDCECIKTLANQLLDGGMRNRVSFAVFAVPYERHMGECTRLGAGNPNLNLHVPTAQLGQIDTIGVSVWKRQPGCLWPYLAEVHVNPG